MHFTFNSRFSLGGEMPSFPLDVVKAEPMFFRASPEFAYKHGGPVTRAFLDRIEDAPLVIDSRVHMLKRGWYPCIPGWHHDDIPRDRQDGQPNYERPKYHARHALAFVGADVSSTEFAVGTIELPQVPPFSGVVYGVWDPLVEAAVRDGRLRSSFAPSHRIVNFDCHALHRGTEAAGTGWRWFGRASWDTHIVPENEIRAQTQVYMGDPRSGW